jgi:hypothetical protein
MPASEIIISNWSFKDRAETIGSSSLVEFNLFVTLGFKDPAYRKRRKMFSEIAIFYKM